MASTMIPTKSPTNETEGLDYLIPNQYGFESSSGSKSNGDTSNYTITMSVEPTIDASFPDLSYNNFQTPLHCRANTIEYLNKNKVQNEKHRSQSAILSVADTESILNKDCKNDSDNDSDSDSDSDSDNDRNKTNTNETENENKNMKDSPKENVKVRSLPIDRSTDNKHTYMHLLQPTPQRRLSLSLSSMTSDDPTYYDRYGDSIEFERDVSKTFEIGSDRLSVRNISRLTPISKRKINCKLDSSNDDSDDTMRSFSLTLDSQHSPNSKTVMVHSNDLSPLLDTSDSCEYSSTTNTSTEYTYHNQLRYSIDEFFNVIDTTGMGSVTFDLLKVCFALLGINLSTKELDILLNQLTQYKPSLPITKEMILKFLFDSNKQIEIIHAIRTEIVISLLSNHKMTNKNKSKSKSKKSKSHSKGSRGSKESKHSKHSKHSKEREENKNKNESNASPNRYRRPPQIRRITNKPSPNCLSPTSMSTLSTLPPLPPICTSNNYNKWLLICFKNSIIDSLMELLHNNELRVYVFEDTIIINYMFNNNRTQILKYLFECQFAFMSNGSAYLDFNGFAMGMTKCNIHFENPSVAIPLIFEELAIKCNGNEAKHNYIDYNHVFIAEDTFVDWMIGYVNQKNTIKDQRIQNLMDLLSIIYQHSKYNKYIQKQHEQSKKSKKKPKPKPKKRRKSKTLNASKTNPFLTQLGLPPRQRLNEYHSYSQKVQKVQNRDVPNITYSYSNKTDPYQ